MSARKHRTREKLTTLVAGKACIGERVVEGTRKLDQYVIYGDQCIADLHGYEAGQKDTIMLEVARQILRELITGKTLNAQPVHKYRL